jgi:DNA transformation protein and related proteins
MAVSDEFLDYVVEQLSLLGRVTVRRMFGGAGLYCDGKMFGLVADDVPYLKVDDSNREHFVQAGSGPFIPFPDKAMAMPYYEIPVDILEDPPMVAQWAQRSLDIARKKQK